MADQPNLNVIHAKLSGHIKELFTDVLKFAKEKDFEYYGGITSETVYDLGSPEYDANKRILENTMGKFRELFSGYDEDTVNELRRKLYLKMYGDHL